MESKRLAAANLLDTAAEFIAQLYGPDEAAHFRRSATDPTATAAPLTWKARLKADVDKLIRSRPITAADFARVKSLHEEMQRKLAAPSEFDQGLIDSPAGRGFAQFLGHARRTIGDSVFNTMVSALTDIGGWADLMVPGMDRDFRPTGSTFEERVRSIATALHRAAEGAYKPFLQVALKLTPTRAKPAPRAQVPSTVGKLINDCRAAWQRTAGPIDVLYDRIEIVRNSEGHIQTEFDPVRETVVFVNCPDGKPVEMIGPWTEPDLIKYGSSFFDLLAMMSLVYRASVR